MKNPALGGAFRCVGRSLFLLRGRRLLHDGLGRSLCDGLGCSFRDGLSRRFRCGFRSSLADRAMRTRVAVASCAALALRGFLVALAHDRSCDAMKWRVA